MNFVDSIIHNQLEEAKRIIFERLDELATEKWEDAKAYLVNDMFEEDSGYFIENELQTNQHYLQPDRAQTQPTKPEPATTNYDDMTFAQAFAGAQYHPGYAYRSDLSA